jgi:cytochrome c oxidase assembly protein Cox11
LESLEERTVLSTAAGGAANHLLIWDPTPVQVGQPTKVFVVALDASNNLVPTYSGTIQLTDTDAGTTFNGAPLPTTYTFQSSDHGFHAFTLTPGVAGMETLTATDTTTSSITGSGVLMVNPAQVATHFLIWDPKWAQAGQPTNVFVVALDASNHVVYGYTGTVQVTDTDAGTTFNGAPLPTTYTFQASDHGFHDFVLTPANAGMETIAATDTSNSSITGSGVLMVAPAQMPTHFLVWDPAPAARVGEPTNVFVVALDASNHIVYGYTGTITLTDTDAGTTFNGAPLPTTYTFQASDHGFHDFVLTPGAAGTETLTATDTSNSSITGVSALLVNPVPVAAHFLIWDPAPVTAGQPTKVFVIAVDASYHLVPNYTGTITLTDTDAATTYNGAALPTTYTFKDSDHGFHGFDLTPGMAGMETVAATDTSNSSLTGMAVLQVAPAATATHFLLWAPLPTIAGLPTEVFVIALDAFNHIVPNYTGTVSLTGFGSGVPSTYTFQPSDHGFHGFLVNLGSGNQTLSVSDILNNAIAGLATFLFNPPHMGWQF